MGKSQVVTGLALQIGFTEIVYAEKQASELKLAPVTSLKFWTMFNGVDFKFNFVQHHLCVRHFSKHYLTTCQQCLLYIEVLKFFAFKN